MNHAAKLLIKDSTNDTYLALYRADHPAFGNSVDLPGGTVEKGETDVEAAVREVYEEIAVYVDQDDMRLLKDTTEYSKHNTRYTLFTTEITAKPTIVLSWEHASYEWVSKERLVKECLVSNDTFMFMVVDCLEKEK